MAITVSGGGMPYRRSLYELIRRPSFCARCSSNVFTLLNRHRGQASVWVVCTASDPDHACFPYVRPVTTNAVSEQPTPALAGATDRIRSGLPSLFTSWKNGIPPFGAPFGPNFTLVGSMVVTS